MLKDKEFAISQINAIIWNSATPYHSSGWPPEMLDHLRGMMHQVAITIVESIYTENELMEKAESIILDKPQQI